MSYVFKSFIAATFMGLATVGVGGLMAKQNHTKKSQWHCMIATIEKQQEEETKEEEREEQQQQQQLEQRRTVGWPKLHRDF